MVVLEVMNMSSSESLLKPRKVLIWNTMHIQEHMLHHEDDLTILRLFVVPNGVAFFHQRNEVLRSRVLADLLGGRLLLEFLHRLVGVLSLKESVTHFEVLWLGQVEHHVDYRDDIIASG